MSHVFKFIVVGRGMMGSAAAKYLSQASDGVALIGPDEPKDKVTHQGVFASHYDEARITRTIDPDPVWALLANRSIARYADIERESGFPFYKEVGCLMVGPKRASGDPYIDGILSAAGQLGVQTELLGNEALADRFSYFGFETESEGVFEPKNAGHINPRGLVAAQSVLAENQGAKLVNESVHSIRREGVHVVVRTDQGEEYRAEQVLLAAGGFSIAENLLARSVQMSVHARTVTFFEVPDDEAAEFTNMPSLIYQPRDVKKHIYLLPPVRYPDGKLYLKIGGDPDDLRVKTRDEMIRWFQSCGRSSVRDHHVDIVRQLVPKINAEKASMAACVVAQTATGYPFIAKSHDAAIAVVTGGCGAAAKSSDEIGRLGAQLLLNGSLSDEGYPVSFAAEFA